MATWLELALSPADRDNMEVKAEQQGLVKSGVHGRSLGRFCTGVKQQLKNTRQYRMLQYFYAGRSAFDIDFKSLSLACDAGRFGKRNCLLSVVCLPDNTAMWAPPAVPHIKKCPGGQAGKLGFNRVCFNVVAGL